MAAAKSTKKATKATTTATKAKPKAKAKTTKPAAKKTKVKKPATAVKTKVKAKPKARAKTKTASKKTNFFSDVVKQATKAQKQAQTQTKALLKALNALDKQQAQLVSKQSKAKGKSWQSLETKLVKLKTQATAARTEVAASQNNADKFSTFIEWTTQLNNKPSVTAYIKAPSAPAPSKPSLVKSPYPTYKPAPAAAHKKEAKPYDDFEDEDLDEGLNFGYDDEDEALDEDLGR